MAGLPDIPHPAAVREQLERILSSPDFDASHRHRRFLRYVTEETLAGRGERVKAYPIAITVFGRDETFDSQIDPIVRIEARRLRSALERYYLLSGRHEPVQIAIPKGSYVPVFSWAAPADAEGTAPQAARVDVRRPGPSVLVLPFESDSEGESAESFARGLTRHLIVALTRFADLFVYGPATSFEAAAAPRSGAAPPLDVDYLVSGSAGRGEEGFRLDVLLTDARTGRHVWAQSFERRLDPATITALRDEVADTVAGTIARPYGLIFAHRVREAEGKAPSQLGSYDCVVRFYQYVAHYDRAMHAEVLACLTRTVREEPDYAEAVACLSMVYTDAQRYGYDAGGERDPLGRALALGRRAVELAPHSSRSHHALGLAYWFGGDVAASLEALETGLALNPNDTEIMGHLGMRWCLRADWDRGLLLIREALSRNPAQPGNIRMGLALWHFMHGRHEQALAEARRLDADGVIYVHMMIAIAAIRLGRRDEARAAVEAILAIDPAYGGRVAEDLAGRQLDPSIVGAVEAALRDAGLPPRPMRVRTIAAR
jgi:adenylate cyclase